MGRVEILGKKYCKSSCDKIAETRLPQPYGKDEIRYHCPLKKELGNDWCPKCEGTVYERDGGGQPVRWIGGWIPVMPKDGHGRALMYACDCELGQLRQAQGCKKYIFGDNEVCMLERTHRHLLLKGQRNNPNNQPSDGHVGELATKVLNKIKEKEQLDDEETPFG